MSEPMRDFLPFIHPIWQGVALALALVTARWGLRLRAGRRRESGESGESRRRLRGRHARMGIMTVWLLGLGWTLGVVGMPYLRNEVSFGTWHAWVGTASLALFLLGGYYGWRLRHPPQSANWSRDDARELHVFCVATALFLALGEIILGFPLLP